MSVPVSLVLSILVWGGSQPLMTLNLWNLRPIQACPKIEHLVWDSLFNISNPSYSQHHILLLAGNERQVKKVLHPLTYLLTSLLRHSYNVAIPVHHFYPIIKFWASHHRHGKCTGQTCRVKGDFALTDPKGLPQ